MPTLTHRGQRHTCPHAPNPHPFHCIPGLCVLPARAKRAPCLKTLAATCRSPGGLLLRLLQGCRFLWLNSLPAGTASDRIGPASLSEHLPCSLTLLAFSLSKFDWKKTRVDSMHAYKHMCVCVDCPQKPTRMEPRQRLTVSSAHPVLGI